MFCFQVKATDSPQILKDGKTISFRVEVADLKWWEDELMPVILVVYNGQKDHAYFIYIQHYLNEKNITVEDLSSDQDRVTIRIPLKNRVNRKTIDNFRKFLLEKQKGAFRHDK